MESEAPLVGVAFRQLRRLAWRAGRRKLLSGVVSLGISAILFAALARRPPLYGAEVGLLISEGAFAADGRPRPRGELLAFIQRAAFATPRLEALVTKHDLAKVFKVPNQELALGRMRKLIDVQTSHDYLESYRERDDPPRTVRLSVGFSAPDATLALAVARDLGELVAETQTKRAIQAADDRVNSRRVVSGAAAARAIGLREDFERAKRIAFDQPGGQAFVNLQSLVESLKAADKASLAAAADLVDAELQARGIRQVGHLVQVIDPGSPPWKLMSRKERLVAQGLLALLVGLGFGVILVGAWHPLVWDEQDLHRAGLPMLGAVPVCGDMASPDV